MGQRSTYNTSSQTRITNPHQEHLGRTSEYKNSTKIAAQKYAQNSTHIVQLV